MDTDNALTIAVVLVIAFFAYLEYTKGPRAYRSRKCQGRSWKTAFPESESDQIRLFLECLVDGMGLSSKTKLKFSPDDKANDIYKSLYGGKVPYGDHLECETFVEALSAHFDKPIKDILEFWDEDVTLGELYAKVSA